MQHGDALIATANKAVAPALEVEPVGWAQAHAATKRFVWRKNHPYPTCFVCGPGSGTSGLHIYPGTVGGRDIAAAPFVVPADLCVNERARPELIWAALDCPSYFGFGAFQNEYKQVLLGQLTASIVTLPRSGQRCVVGGWSLGKDGRKIRCRSALWSDEGELLAEAEALWIELREP